MISLIFVVRPTDRSPARDLGRDSITYTISHLIVSLHLCGKNQYATMPGSAVVPCIEYKGIAGAGITAIGHTVRVAAARRAHESEALPPHIVQASVLVRFVGRTCDWRN